MGVATTLRFAGKQDLAPDAGREIVQVSAFPINWHGLACSRRSSIALAWKLTCERRRYGGQENWREKIAVGSTIQIGERYVLGASQANEWDLLRREIGLHHSRHPS